MFSFSNFEFLLGVLMILEHSLYYAKIRAVVLISLFLSRSYEIVDTDIEGISFKNILFFKKKEALGLFLLVQ